MARSRHRKWKRQRHTPDEDRETKGANNIEEDLRLQRIRQQQRREAENEKDMSQAMVVEEDEHDLEYDAPSPSAISSTLPQHWIIKEGSFPKHVPEVSHLWGITAFQHSPPWPNVRRRRRLLHWTASRYLLENLSIDPQASAMYSRKFRRPECALPNDVYCAGDLACKYYLQPSARTMDVAGGGIRWDGSVDETALPTIATTLQGGWGLQQPQLNAIFRSKPVHSIRIHAKSQTLGTVIRDDSSPLSYKFQWYSLPDAASFTETELPNPVHDFALGNDLAIFSCPRFGGGGKSILTPLILPLDDSSHLGIRSLNVQNFPQSDALRVEMSCHQEKYLAFAHRNGQVSLLDLRQSHTCSAIISSEDGSPTEMGSATDIAFLSSQTQLLVKRSFGPCQLHDLRKLSPCPSSLIHTLTVPDHDSGQISFHKTLSAHCTGFCVDPLTETTLVSPFINKMQEPCLGVWSLTTGDMVGCKVLYSNPKRDPFFVELCSRVTPAFRPKVDPSSFGVWMKCGRFSEERISIKKGSLHHLCFPGRYLAPNE